jgi:hypothetical protein
MQKRKWFNGFSEKKAQNQPYLVVNGIDIQQHTLSIFICTGE